MSASSQGIGKMPGTCWVKDCFYLPGRSHNGHEIKLHTFPNCRERVVEWLLQLIPAGDEVNALAEDILTMKRRKYNKYRLCSLHFTEDSFIVNVCGRVLRPKAIPTIFPNFLDSDRKVAEDLTKAKAFKRKRLDNLSAPEASKKALIPESSIKTESSEQTESGSSPEIQHFPEIVESPRSKFSDVSIQTDCDLTNSMVIIRDPKVFLMKFVDYSTFFKTE
ncbi:THAP domain-containing protein 5-like [Bufo gargarizans]|uniref:THAP domain-containing protein 5-like n=1 Tax=Bufo gargarizans TaxID=30331 RepID=UPI001CF0D99C|nr:THAP domain-containing protein 5-like [Bufo gargarizans]